jgi:C-terminal processing protease CtpA/Prc
MVLIDGETSGASELLAAVLKEWGRGVLLIGQPTGADPLVREAIPLNGRRAYIATRSVRIGGSVFDGRQPVAPGILLRSGAMRERFYEPESLDRPWSKLLDEEKEDKALRDRINGDTGLQRAVDILLGLKALNIDYEGNRSPPKP